MWHLLASQAAHARAFTSAHSARARSYIYARAPCMPATRVHARSERRANSVFTSIEQSEDIN